MALTNKLTAIADAIRAKTGETGKMTLEQMPAKIGAISGGGGGGGFDTSHIKATISMFEGSDAQSIDVSGLDTSSVISMDRMFAGCSSIKSLDLSSLNTGRLMMANEMFMGCTNLEVLDISSFGNIESVDRFISDCDSLSVIKIGKDSDTGPIFCYFKKDSDPSGYPEGFQIQVPAHLVDAYKADSSWADYVDQIVPRP